MKKRVLKWALVLGCFLLMVACLPLPTFKEPCATVLFSKEGKLLAARISKDQQWRFEEEQTIPIRFQTCLLHFEDKHFFLHPGINPVALFRAVYLNLRHASIRSGASTLTMQAIRIGRHHPKRTFLEKGYEILLSLKMEMVFSKKKILRVYCSQAPFGNNVVGLSAATWRYYNKSPEQLSWAEAATLAVLPNAPSLIYPGKRNALLLKKRNKLLKELVESHEISQEEYQHALIEPLPEKPLALPTENETLLQCAIHDGLEGKRIYSDVSATLQAKVRQVSLEHLRNFADDDLRAAVIVAEVQTGRILSYQGNIGTGSKSYVDCIQAHRSSGSVLKPLLFAQALDLGIITPQSVIPDIPAAFGNYMPNNYAKSFEGWVPAREALARSMNVPMIFLLREVGIQRFKTSLHELGFNQVKVNKEDYGLPLIVGGADVSLFEVANAYTQLASRLKTQNALVLHLGPEVYKRNLHFSDAAIYESFQAISGMKRPDENGQWQNFENPKRIAWKTGTSFGNRDAWAIGISHDYVVGVWLGHEQAQSDQNLVGFKAAAPLLFRVMNQLRGSTQWFVQPKGQYTEVNLCRVTGKLAGTSCSEIVKVEIPSSCSSSMVCTEHQWIYVNEDSSLRVHPGSYDDTRIKKMSALIVSPLIEKYLVKSGKINKVTPPWQSGEEVVDANWQIQYPSNNTTIHLNQQGDLPVELAGVQHKKLYWHLDDLFIATTEGEEQKVLHPPVGHHTLLISDEQGQRVSCSFQIE